MMTTKIQITPYLAEYIKGKYNNGADEPVDIPASTDLYHVVWTLMAKRQKNQSPVDEGNLSIILPERRVGKDPAVFNYLSPRSASLIEDEIRRMFNHELHQTLLDNMTQGHVARNLDVIYSFMNEYCITSISEESLLKNFYRWRESLRKRTRRREYRKRT